MTGRKRTTAEGAGDGEDRAADASTERVSKRGTAGVYKRAGSASYWISFTFNGQRVRESAKTTNKKDATDLLAKRKTEVRNGTYWPEARKAGLTIAALRDRWMQAKATKASIGADASRWKRIVAHFGEHRQIATLVAGDVAAFRDALAATEIQRFEDEPKGARKAGRPRKGTAPPARQRKRMSPSAVNKHLVLLRAALNLAAKEGFIHRSPAAGVSLVPGETQRDRVITGEEFAKLSAAASPDMRVALALAWWCGLRRSEIAELTWDRVDLRHRTIRLRNVDTKTGQPREVAFPNHVLAVLKQHPRNVGGAVIGLRPDSISRIFGRMCKQLGIRNARLHDSRHSTATRMVEAGIDVVTIAETGGWKDMKSMRRYMNLSREHKRNAMDRAAAFEDER